MEKAILLPWGSKVFLQAYDTKVTGSVKSARVTIHTGDSSLLKWLLNQLITYLMLYKCVHTKFSTILYHRVLIYFVGFKCQQSLTVKYIIKPTDKQSNTDKESNKVPVLHITAYLVND